MEVKQIEFEFKDNEIQNEQNQEQSYISQANQSFTFDKHQLDQETTSVNKSSNFQASVNMLKCLTGIGILGLSNGFLRSGIILAIIVLLFVYASCYYTTTLLVDVQKKYQADRGENTNISWQMILGRKSIYFYQLNNIVLQIGCCVSYVIFFIKFFEIALDLENTIGNRFLFLLLSLIVIGPMSLISNYSKFYKWSQLGNFLSLTTLIVVTIYNMDRFQKVNYQMKYADFSNLGAFFGTTIFSFEIVNQIPFIQNSMKTPNDFQRMLKYVIIFYGFFIVSFCSFDSLAQQDSLYKHRISLIGIQKENKYLIILQCFYAISLTISYPIQLFPIIAIFEESEYYKKHTKLKLHFRFGLTLLIFMIAFIVPDFSSFLNLVGSVAGISLQFGFPIIVYYQTFKYTASKYKLYYNWTLLFVTIIFGFISFLKSIEQLSQGHQI